MAVTVFFLRPVLLQFVCVFFVSCSWIAFGFTASPIAGRANGSRGRGLALRHHQEDTYDGADGSSSFCSSARKTRIDLPLQLIGGSFLAWGSTAIPAHAGVGSVAPFDETRRTKFRGSIANSVVLLRLKSTLRKRGYFAGKAAVATLKPQDDLGVLLSSEFGAGRLPVGLSSSSSMREYIQSAQENGKKALILYGQDVTISPDGQVSPIEGSDLKSSEKFLLEELAGVDATIVGGIVIHRTKSGPRSDAGEDCFSPMAITSIDKNGVVTDLFGEVFGDLPTSRQTVRLPG